MKTDFVRRSFLVSGDDWKENNRWRLRDSWLDINLNQVNNPVNSYLNLTGSRGFLLWIHDSDIYI